MNRALNLHACLGLVTLLWGTSYADRCEPRFLNLDRQHSRAAKQEAILQFPGRDKGLQHTLFLLSDSSDQPLLFYADISTPVCIDEICKPVRIALYWDLLGNYAGYGVPPDSPLTKYDHVLFEPADYMKLHQLLMDRKSMLGRKTLADMFDPHLPVDARNITYRGKTLDAISGATSKEFTGSVVPGALYSCYTIWHLAHGDVRQKMLGHLKTIYGPALARQFLDSKNADYQFYALQQMSDSQLNDHLPIVLEFMQNSEPAARATILKKLPRPAWRQASITRAVYHMFTELDGDLRALLIQNLSNARASAAEILADQVESMTKKQLQGYLSFLADDPQRQTESITAKLQQIASTERYAYCYVVDAFLRH